MRLRQSVFALMLAVPTLAQAAPCASRAEMDALDMRVLQTDLMVAALACPNLRQPYGQFVEKHRSHLVEHTSTLKRYIKRAGQEVNQFITEMSNQSSNISLRLPESAYCQRAQLLFGEIYSQEHAQLLDSLIQTPNITGRHKVTMCQ